MSEKARKIKQPRVAHRLGILSLHEAVSLMEDPFNSGGFRSIVTISDQQVKITEKLKIICRKGLACVRCGLLGSFFAAEKLGNDQFYVLHLYGKVVIKRRMLKQDILLNKEILFTVDHLFPKSRGGRDTVKNLVPMCYGCNQQKKNRLPQYIWTDKQIEEFSGE